MNQIAERPSEEEIASLLETSRHLQGSLGTTPGTTLRDVIEKVVLGLEVFEVLHIPHEFASRRSHDAQQSTVLDERYKLLAIQDSQLAIEVIQQLAGRRHPLGETTQTKLEALFS